MYQPLVEYVVVLSGYDTMACRDIQQVLRVFARSQSDARWKAAQEASWYTRHAMVPTKFLVASVTPKEF